MIINYTVKHGMILDEPLTDTALNEVDRAKLEQWFQKSFADRINRANDGILMQFGIYGGCNTATTSSNSAPVPTIEKMMDMLRDFQSKFPTPPRVDLYGHDLGDQCYELNRPAKKRKFIVVPRNRLISIFHELKSAGVDVRLEPRYGDYKEDMEVDLNAFK